MKTKFIKKYLYYKNIRKVINESEIVIITAGAGMGVDSGLPDFRGNVKQPTAEAMGFFYTNRV